ncbi:MAG: hypothetical protein K0S28_1546 [Paucimonas sp.]|nr:hypothetical protein [Paucimonas sp.]
MLSLSSAAIFCRVVDNYGDIGICWRLARQLQHEHGIAVTLWVDDLHTFRRICPQASIDAEMQQQAGVTVRRWRDWEGIFTANDVADIVIEFFGCDIPPGYISAMTQCDPRPVWLNLEGLTAEEWVEGCHTLPSPHPRLPLTKHFFFPGFTSRTGGLLHEAGLDKERERFQSDSAAVAAFLSTLGVADADMAALKVSLFCYPHAPVTALFDAWQAGSESVTCLVPEGVATDAVHAFLDQAPQAGATRTCGRLTICVIPFLPQQDYDKLLWACDLNFVRGEDSFVRAQWADRPFIWHIYPQDENLHHKKLKAFLGRYAATGTHDLADFALSWNGAQSPEKVATWWPALRSALPAIAQRCPEWRGAVLENGDLASNLLKFAASQKAVSARKKV